MNDVILNKPFRIDNCFENGELKDWTVFKKDKKHIWVYFRDIKKWVNPPTERMELDIIRSIEKHGVVYVEEKDLLNESK